MSAAAEERRGRYENLRTDDYLGPVQVETRLESEPAFTEGPAVDRQGRVYFTNIPQSKILRWHPESRSLETFREDSQEANGLMFDREGRLLACEGESGRLVRIDVETDETTVLANRYAGLPLAPPNDLCWDQQGRIYFSSRPSGFKGPETTNANAVYRWDPDGSLHQILAEPEVHMPNGLVLSPDETTFYLVEAHPDANRHRDIRAYDLQADGSVRNGRVLIDFYPGRSGDGMCIDEEGNLYIAAGLHRLRDTSETLETRPGIHVVSPRGELLAFRETPEDTITNCTFGGEDLCTLYITCGSLLLSLRTAIAGKPSYRPLAS